MSENPLQALAKDPGNVGASSGFIFNKVNVVATGCFLLSSEKKRHYTPEKRHILLFLNFESGSNTVTFMSLKQEMNCFPPWGWSAFHKNVKACAIQTISRGAADCCFGRRGQECTKYLTHQVENRPLEKDKWGGENAILLKFILFLKCLGLNNILGLNWTQVSLSSVL